MATTSLKALGDWGEAEVCKAVTCPVCGTRALQRLTTGFPSLDIICRNCAAYMAQVKTHTVKAGQTAVRPTVILGSGWRPLQTQIRAAQLRDMYVVGVEQKGKKRIRHWIDLIPGNALYSNAQVFDFHIHTRKGGQKYPMFSIRLGDLPPACVISIC